MRVLLALLLAAAAPCVVAQDAPSTPEPGVFGQLGASVGYGSTVGAVQTNQALLGYRFTNGFHVALAAHESRADRAVSTLFGPELGYSRGLGPNTTLQLRLDGRASLRYGVVGTTRYQDAAYSSTASGAVTRRFTMGRSAQLAVTGGLYAGAARLSALDTLDGAAQPGGTVSELGAILGLQVEFEALGGRFGIGPHGGIPALWHGTSRGVGQVYRGRGTGFLTFTF